MSLLRVLRRQRRAKKKIENAPKFGKIYGV